MRLTITVSTIGVLAIYAYPHMPTTNGQIAGQLAWDQLNEEPSFQQVHIETEGESLESTGDYVKNYFL